MTTATAAAADTGTIMTAATAAAAVTTTMAATGMIATATAIGTATLMALGVRIHPGIPAEKTLADPGGPGFSLVLAVE